MTLLATIVDTSALLKVVAASLVAVVGVTLAVSLAILGATRFADMRARRAPARGDGLRHPDRRGARSLVGSVVVGVVVMSS